VHPRDNKRRSQLCDEGVLANYSVFVTTPNASLRVCLAFHRHFDLAGIVTIVRPLQLMFKKSAYLMVKMHFIEFGFWL
jgi:hypothetical protein